MIITFKKFKRLKKFKMIITFKKFKRLKKGVAINKYTKKSKNKIIILSMAILIFLKYAFLLGFFNVLTSHKIY